MDLGIRGRKALIVGGSRSIGRAVAVKLAREGAHVTVAARDADALFGLREVLGTRQCTTIAGDLMRPDGVEQLVDRYVSEMDSGPDIIYHAIGGSVEGLRDSMLPSAAWAKVWHFNLGISIDINCAFIPGMRDRQWGRIVHTSSDATKCNSGNAPYTSAKFAVEGYVKTVSKQLAAMNVILTCIAPGNLKTPGKFPSNSQGAERAEYFRHHLPAARFCDPEEIAAAVLPLCGEPASFMPGAIVRADGGSR